MDLTIFAFELAVLSNWTHIHGMNVTIWHVWKN